MADQEVFKTIVLSIFKGENFVTRNIRTPCGVHLKAICPDLQPELILETQAVQLTSTITEPEFNSQLGWSVSRKQLKELRSNRSIIKVTCVVTDRMGTTSDVGYIVLHVKDATVFAPDVLVDSSKSDMIPLLGTKEHWRTHQPKVQMVLHLEEIPSDSRVFNQSKPIHSTIRPALPTLPELDKSGDNQTVFDVKIENGAKLSETKVLSSVKGASKFSWTIMEKEGYFQLGDATEDDDLYYLNTTVVSASYLHSLWDGKSPRKSTSDNNFWQIKYEAYNCEIASDPFLLQNDDESRRTFIGDKATAKVRANGAMFFEYLQNTNLQFQVLRYQFGPLKELANPEVMGICFASLNELSTSISGEYKLSMDVLSEWGTPGIVKTHGKPEVRVVFVVQSVPKCFKSLENGLKTNNKVIRPHEQIDPTNDTSANLQTSNSDSILSRSIDAVNEPENEVEGFDAPLGSGNANEDVVTLGNSSNFRRLLQYEDQTKGHRNQSPPSSSSFTLTRSHDRHSDKNANKNLQQKHRSSSSATSESEDSDSTSNKENLARIMPPPGDYIVTIELNKFWLKSRKRITDDFILTYSHSPLEVSDMPIECYAQPLEPDAKQTRQGFLVQNGKYSKTVRISNFTETLLNEPLTIDFFRSNTYGKSHGFASAMLPFGRIFLKGGNKVRVMEDSADILKIKENMKIGELFFKIKMVHESNSGVQPEMNNNTSGSKQQKNSAFFPPPSTNENKSPTLLDKYSRDSDKAEKITEDMKEWRRAQEKMYKRQKEESETAYLKILQAENAKRDEERENAMAKKLTELEKKQKELNRLLKLTEEREEKLKQMDLELKDRTRTLTLEQESLQQKSTLALRRLEEDHKIEVEVLQRRIQDFQDDGSKLKRKITLLEKKLETKEAEIDNLTALTRTLPDVSMVKRVSTLEEENKSLKIQLRESNGRKEQYKKQSLALCQKLNRIQEERDQELKDQNENLRLQILANQEHKELKKERKAVQGLSQTLKALQKETLVPTSDGGKGDCGGFCDPIYKSGIRVVGNSAAQKTKEDEINRLSAERTKLLQSGAYTNFDAVIKELEKKMAVLASSP